MMRPLVCLLAASAGAASAAKSKPQNFVVLFMDDNGWGDSGVNSKGRVKETPR